jgi:hypothetical protein
MNDETDLDWWAALGLGLLALGGVVVCDVLSAVLQAVTS